MDKWISEKIVKKFLGKIEKDNDLVIKIEKF
jgi:hypothetical protein